MNIIEIHAASFATRIGQVAAAELSGCLAPDYADFPTPNDTWFDPTRSMPSDDGAAADEVAGRLEALDKLGEYVCKNQVEAGERLYRYATGQHVVMAIGDWAALSFEQRQPWETFTSTCRQAFNDLKAAQLAILDARKAAAAQAPAGLKREDSIFEEVEDTFALRPEAVEFLKLSPIYERGQAAELQRIHNSAEDQLRADAEAENAAFDAARTPEPTPRAPRKPKAKPAPLSAGEAPVQPPRNRGGRGNKKTPAS